MLTVFMLTVILLRVAAPLKYSTVFFSKKYSARFAFLLEVYIYSGYLAWLLWEAKQKVLMLFRHHS